MNNRLIFIGMIIVLITLRQNAQPIESWSTGPENHELPIRMNPDSVKPLRTLIDAEFQTDLEMHLNSNTKWARLLHQKRLAVGVVDLSNPDKAKYARINGNVMMYAASLTGQSFA